MRLFVRSVLVVAFVGLAACEDQGPNVQRFTAAADGAQETPATSVTATGTGTLNYDGSAMQYQIDIAGPLDSITAAHIHAGPPGVPGGIILNLFLGPTTGLAFNGTLVSGVTSVPSGMTMARVVELMQRDSAYLNIHTRVNGGGAIRGRIVPVQ